MPHAAAPRLDARDCADCPIRHNAVCALCEAEELQALNQLKSYVAFEPGDNIAWMGEPLDFVGSIVSGAAILSRTMEDGRRQMLGLMLPSDFIGRPGRPSVSYDIEAVAPTVICRFSKAGFDGLIARSDSIKRRLIEMTMDELDAARDWMLVLGRKTAREKVASLLCVLARRRETLAIAEDPANVAVDLPLTREQIADSLGLTIETVSRQFSALKRSGVIELEGQRRVITRDMRRLLIEAGDDTDGGVDG